MSRQTHTQGGAPPDTGRGAGDLGDVIARLRTREQVPGGNVVLFASRRPPSTSAPPLHVGAAQRPAPMIRRPARGLVYLGLLTASLLAHSALLLWFDHAPAPLASVGEVSVSVELVLGAQAAAGQSSTPSPSEVESAAAPESEDPQADTPQTARAEPETAQQDSPPEPAVTQAEPPASEPQAAVQPSEAPAPTPDVTVAPSAELPVPAKPAEAPRRAEPRELPAARAPERKRIEAARPSRDTPRRAERGESARTQSAPASTASAASSGIGVGRSDAVSNYRGIVAAHLARHKQFPAEARARGAQGTTTVTFSIDGGGRVTSVQLGRASGIASIDRETEAMVRRASPFPAPPGGRGMSFTAPVSFHLR